MIDLRSSGLHAPGRPLSCSAAPHRAIESATRSRPACRRTREPFAVDAIVAIARPRSCLPREAGIQTEHGGDSSLEASGPDTPAALSQ
jgi:hypothetical protein